MSGNKKPLCSIKGCTYDAIIETTKDNRTFRLCPKHRFMVINPFQWVKIEVKTQ